LEGTEIQAVKSESNRTFTTDPEILGRSDGKVNSPHRHAGFFEIRLVG